MKEYLFTYGTLSPEHAPREISEAVRRLNYVGEASVNGLLYDLGSYPGAIIDAPSPKKIIGRVFTLPEDRSVLQALDEYEGFNSKDIENSLFVRKSTEVILKNGQKIKCWIYIYNRDPSEFPLISSGDYMKREAA